MSPQLLRESNDTSIRRRCTEQNRSNCCLVAVAKQFVEQISIKLLGSQTTVGQLTLFRFTFKVSIVITPPQQKRLNNYFSVN